MVCLQEHESTLAENSIQRSPKPQSANNPCIPLPCLILPHNKWASRHHCIFVCNQRHVSQQLTPPPAKNYKLREQNRPQPSVSPKQTLRVIKFDSGCLCRCSVEHSFAVRERTLPPLVELNRKSRKRLLQRLHSCERAKKCSMKRDAPAAAAARHPRARPRPLTCLQASAKEGIKGKKEAKLDGWCWSKTWKAGWDGYLQQHFHSVILSARR